MSPLLYILILSSVTADIPTPSSLLGPKHYNHHAYEQYLKEVEPTKQGPILFPNDAPPPPRTPLIVTSRPLLDSIARSDLNNSVAEQSIISRVYQPQYFRQYDYENQQPALHPIYKAISDHAQQNLNAHQKPRVNYNNYKVNEPDYSKRYESNNINDDNSDHSQAQNYAFSYIVKDQKTGDDFSHSQQSRGSATNGEYRVRLPDGRMQIVSYTADENGYKADVRYDDDTTGNSIDNNVNSNFKARNNIDYNVNRNFNKDYNGNFESNQNYVNNRDYDTNRNQNLNYNANQNINYDYKDQQPYNIKHINDLTNNNYGTNEETKPVTEQHYKDDYSQYADSKEYFGNDYSLEYDDKYDKYDPHKSKFTAFTGPKNPKFVPKKSYVTASTVKPSYEELKPLFIQKKPFKDQQPTNDYLYSSIPIQINLPSTTSSPYFDGTTERVVVIGKPKNLYTSVTSSISPIPVTPVPKYTVSNIPVTSPRSFLASTIASFVNLKKNIDFSGAKPVLTNTFIDKINRYLSYK
ncbi:uncharacterized protein [Choristoneura fumiferana]|uniref:uncharacterized protein n=1 Tax=Choristoneura fumiferana TaxID=7141 RepID=UPI003D157FA9